MKDGNLFKNMRESKDTKNDLKANPEIKNILKDHVMLREGVSDNALVSLVVRFNGHELNEDSVHELELFKYINKDGNLTDAGKEFIEEEATIMRLKEMVV
jgi:hypothetical protein